MVEKVKNGKCAVHHTELILKVWTTIDCFNRFRFLDFPMHGLGGIISNVMAIIHNVFTRYKRFFMYVVFANVIISGIESFHLDWCKVKMLPKAS